MQTKNSLIDVLKLEPLTEEGGYFRRIYESDDMHADGRRYGASIYYMLEAPDFSCFHQIDCDELWHFYTGNTVILHQLGVDGSYRSDLLGNPMQDELALPCVKVAAGTCFAAELQSKQGFCLVGCTTIPEFRFDGFKAALRNELTDKFPQHEELIKRLTRK